MFTHTAHSLVLVIVAASCGFQPVYAEERSDVTKAGSDRPIALVGDQRLSVADLSPALLEAAGGQVLQERALDILVKTECEARGVQMPSDAIVDEQKLLESTLVTNIQVGPDERHAIIDRIKRSRGLGETRYNALLTRNAHLRALVRAKKPGEPGAVAVSPDDIDTAYQLKYGQRHRVRLILAKSLTDASRARDRLVAGEAFDVVAQDLSTDPSALNGGRIPPLSLADPNYPVAFRRICKDLKVGELSDAVSVNWAERGGTVGSEQSGASKAVTGYVVVRLDEIVEPRSSPAKESVQGELEREVRLVRERVEMDRLARELLRSRGVTVMDSTLDWSWASWNQQAPQQ